MFKETEDRMELQLGVGMCSLIIKTCTFKELECQWLPIVTLLICIRQVTIFCIEIEIFMAWLVFK